MFLAYTEPRHPPPRQITVPPARYLCPHFSHLWPKWALLDLESVIQYVFYPKLFFSLTFMHVLSSSFTDKTLQRIDQGHTYDIALNFVYMQTLRIFV